MFCYKRVVSEKCSQRLFLDRGHELNEARPDPLSLPGLASSVQPLAMIDGAMVSYVAGKEGNFPSTDVMYVDFVQGFIKNVQGEGQDHVMD